MPWVSAKKRSGHGQRSHWDGLQGSRLKGSVCKANSYTAYKAQLKFHCPKSHLTSHPRELSVTECLKRQKSLLGQRHEVGGEQVPPTTQGTSHTCPRTCQACGLLGGVAQSPPSTQSILYTAAPPREPNVLISHHCLLTTPVSTTPLMGRHPVLNTPGLPESPPPLRPEPDLSAFVVSPHHSE